MWACNLLFLFLPYLWLSALGHGYLMIVSCKYQKATGENHPPLKVRLRFRFRSHPETPRKRNPRKAKVRCSTSRNVEKWKACKKAKGGVAASCKCHMQSEMHIEKCFERRRGATVITYTNVCGIWLGTCHLWASRPLTSPSPPALYMYIYSTYMWRDPKR